MHSIFQGKTLPGGKSMKKGALIPMTKEEFAKVVTNCDHLRNQNNWI